MPSGRPLPVVTLILTVVMLIGAMVWHGPQRAAEERFAASMGHALDYCQASHGADPADLMALCAVSGSPGLCSDSAFRVDCFLPAEGGDPNMKAARQAHQDKLVAQARDDWEAQPMVRWAIAHGSPTISGWFLHSLFQPSIPALLITVLLMVVVLAMLEQAWGPWLTLLVFWVGGPLTALAAAFTPGSLVGGAGALAVAMGAYLVRFRRSDIRLEWLDRSLRRSESTQLSYPAWGVLAVWSVCGGLLVLLAPGSLPSLVAQLSGFALGALASGVFAFIGIEGQLNELFCFSRYWPTAPEPQRGPEVPAGTTTASETKTRLGQSPPRPATEPTIDPELLATSVADWLVYTAEMLDDPDAATPLRPQDVSSLPGRQFPIPFGRYQLTGIAGEGGMAIVFRGILPGPMGFEKDLVVKLIRPALLADEAFRNTLTTEALIGGQLHHRNIVEVYEFGEQDGQFFLAMELVDGISLAYLLRRQQRLATHLPPAIVLEWLRQLLAGLDYAHSAVGKDGAQLGVIHRDLKPSNIVISPTGTIKILDFGIASAAVGRTLDSATTTVGTPRYMSPEQTLNAPQLTAASDLFSLGVILYEVVTLGRLFQMKPGQKLARSVLDMPLDEPLRQADAQFPGMGALLERLLARDPARRFESAAAVSRALQPLLDAQGDTDAARRWLADTVGETKAEAARVELPQFVQPGFATGWDPTAGTS